MSKSDYPALRMKVEKGRLVPASQFDQERIDSYRNGATVMVRLTEEKDRVLIKKWFAIIGLVLKQCDTPWKNKDEAHEAIKLALGIVNLSKTVGGQFMQYPKSLSELDDPEMTEALENMTELLSRLTGVDVETLKKETAHVGANETTNSGDPSHSPSPDTAGEVPPSTASPATLLECAREFLALAIIPYDTPAEIDLVFRHCKEEWDGKFPDRSDTVKSIATRAYAVATGKRTIDQARSFMSETLGCSIEELGGKANG